MSEMNRVAPQLADAAVLDGEGREHRLGDQWKDRPAVIMWVRHFG
jgi:hypothetical protein